jgi:YafQ family addiction module toxin component
MYNLAIKPEVDKIFEKLAKKDRKQLETIRKKVDAIIENPHHGYKFLRKPLQGYNRVHIETHFVLIFKIDHENHLVTLYAYNHHDTVYQWQPQTNE